MDAADLPVFHPFGASHIAAIAVLVTLAVTFVVLERTGRVHAVRGCEIVLAALLLCEWPLNVWIAWRWEALDSGNAFPLHLCDLAAYLGALALMTHHAGLCELLWFWGLAGTLQGLVTPALTVDWPHPRFIAFFALHCGVVLAAFHLVIGRRITPRRGAVARAVGWLVVYVAVVGGVNALIRACGGDANYGFICNKPPTASLFDVLGPWPWYIGVTIGLAFVLFSVLDLPFALARRGTGRRSPQLR
jgi:hypothetical integral membrane protein (TIGR02206 family)